MPPDEPVFRCAACGSVVASVDLLAAGMHCPNLGTDTSGDHVLVRVEDTPSGGHPPGRIDCRDGGAPPGHNPFVTWRRRLTAWDVARTLGMEDEAFVRLVEDLDESVASVDGQGFRERPLLRSASLDAELGFQAPGGLWLKDETGNVSGSHKARHLAAVMLYLKVMACRGRTPAERAQPRLAISSCGNAALAAAVVARAAGYRLEVFVPPSAQPAVLARLQELGVQVATCERRPGERGDPCYRRFREATSQGAVAFCCQGPDNALTVEGGETLAWEIVERLEPQGLDRVFVQVGGGALASACVRGFVRGVAEGRWPRMPRVHAVQTAGGFPLARAWAAVALRALDGMLFGSVGFDAAVPAEIRQFGVEACYRALQSLAWVRGDEPESVARAVSVDQAALAACAAGLRSESGAAAAGATIEGAARERGAFMWAWEREPVSLAHGILDDETYDWRAVVAGMLESGGWPIVVTEAQVAAANHLARAHTGIDVDHTGSAGLAGVIALRAGTPVVAPTERVAVLLSGRGRKTLGSGLYF